MPRINNQYRSPLPGQNSIPSTYGWTQKSNFTISEMGDRRGVGSDNAPRPSTHTSQGSHQLPLLGLISAHLHMPRLKIKKISLFFGPI